MSSTVAPAAKPDSIAHMYADGVASTATRAATRASDCARPSRPDALVSWNPRARTDSMYASSWMASLTRLSPAWVTAALHSSGRGALRHHPVRMKPAQPSSRPRPAARSIASLRLETPSLR